MTEQFANRTSSLLANKGQASPSMFDMGDSNLSSYRPADSHNANTRRNDGLNGLVKRQEIPRPVKLPQISEGEVLALVRQSKLKLDVCDNDRDVETAREGEKKVRRQLTVRLSYAEFRRLKSYVLEQDSTYQDVLAKGVMEFLEKD